MSTGSSFHQEAESVGESKSQGQPRYERWEDCELVWLCFVSSHTHSTTLQFHFSRDTLMRLLRKLTATRMFIIASFIMAKSKIKMLTIGRIYR